MSIAIDSATNKAVDLLATSQALRVYVASLQSGELQQYNRLAAGTIAQKSTAITSTAAVAVCASPCVFYGLFVMSSGSGTGTLSVWDGTTATGSTWLSAAAVSSANTIQPAAGIGSAGMGVLFGAGLTVQQSSLATVYALFAPST